MRAPEHLVEGVDARAHVELRGERHHRRPPLAADAEQLVLRPRAEAQHLTLHGAVADDQLDGGNRILGVLVDVAGRDQQVLEAVLLPAAATERIDPVLGTAGEAPVGGERHAVVRVVQRDEARPVQQRHREPGLDRVRELRERRVVRHELLRRRARLRHVLDHLAADALPALDGWVGNLVDVVLERLYEGVAIAVRLGNQLGRVLVAGLRRRLCCVPHRLVGRDVLQHRRELRQLDALPTQGLPENTALLAAEGGAESLWHCVKVAVAHGARQLHNVVLVGLRHERADRQVVVDLVGLCLRRQVEETLGAAPVGKHRTDVGLVDCRAPLGHRVVEDLLFRGHEAAEQHAAGRGNRLAARQLLQRCHSLRAGRTELLESHAFAQAPEERGSGLPRRTGNAGERLPEREVRELSGLVDLCTLLACLEQLSGDAGKSPQQPQRIQDHLADEVRNAVLVLGHHVVDRLLARRDLLRPLVQLVVAGELPPPAVLSVGLVGKPAHLPALGQRQVGVVAVGEDRAEDLLCPVRGILQCVEHLANRLAGDVDGRRDGAGEDPLRLQGLTDRLPDRVVECLRHAVGLDREHDRLLVLLGHRRIVEVARQHLRVEDRLAWVQRLRQARAQLRAERVRVRIRINRSQLLVELRAEWRARRPGSRLVVGVSHRSHLYYVADGTGPVAPSRPGTVACNPNTSPVRDRQRPVWALVPAPKN